MSIHPEQLESEGHNPEFCVKESTYKIWSIEKSLKGLNWRTEIWSEKGDLDDSMLFILKNFNENLKKNPTFIKGMSSLSWIKAFEKIIGHDWREDVKQVFKDLMTFPPIDISINQQKVKDPFEIKFIDVSKEDIEDLKKWSSIKNASEEVWISIGNNFIISPESNTNFHNCFHTVHGGWNKFTNCFCKKYDFLFCKGEEIFNKEKYTFEISIYHAMRAYFSSFFDVKYKNDYSSLIRLWKKGLVPSFDGKTWRLHSGEKAEIVWEGSF